MGELLEAAFLSGRCQGYILRSSCDYERQHTRVEEGSNTSIVTLRVVGGEEKEVSDLRQ
jgi:hypothetical protein